MDKADALLRSLKVYSYPINEIIKRSKNIEEFDLKICEYVRNVNSKKREKGIPDKREMGGFLYK